MYKKLCEVAWEDFHKLSFKEKSAFLVRKEDGAPYHTLYAQQFDYEMIDRLVSLSNTIRKTAKNRDGAIYLRTLLSHKRAMLYFSQPSSRTFLSFLSACQILGLQTGEVRDTSTSSEFKGESQEDSIRTFSSYFDMIVMRSPEQGLAEKMSHTLSISDRPVPIINAGSGKDQHPTQALLDIYTLLRSFEKNGGLKNRTVVFCGDLLRGRTVRSLSYLLTNYENIKQIFVAPSQLQVAQDVLDILDQNNVSYELTGDLKSVIPQADAVYMTRIQDEWDESDGESDKIDTSNYKFGMSELDLLPENGIIMHPLPRRDEISTDVDNDHRAMFWRQMRNGMWIRAALIALAFGVEMQILEYFADNKADA